MSREGKTGKNCMFERGHVFLVQGRHPPCHRGHHDLRTRRLVSLLRNFSQHCPNLRKVFREASSGRVESVMKLIRGLDLNKYWPMGREGWNSATGGVVWCWEVGPNKRRY